MRLVQAAAPYLTLMALGFMTACTLDKPTAVTPSSVIAPPVIQTACLPMKTYTLAQQQAVAAELSKLSDNDPVAGMVTDYGQMRAANRACIGGGK